MARLFNAARRKKSKSRFTNLDLENYMLNEQGFAAVVGSYGFAIS